MTGTGLGFNVRGVLCDSAVVADSKLYVQGGGWNVLSTTAYPLAVARIGLGALIEVPWDETDRPHQMHIALVDEDGRPHRVRAPGGGGDLVPVEASAHFTVGRGPLVLPGEYQMVPFAANFDGVVFASPGAFSMVFRIDGEEYERVRFRAMPVRESPQ